MIENLPNWINVLFVTTWLLTLAFFYYSNGKPHKILLGIILWQLFLYQMIPELMTFEGRNFDILAGIILF